MSTLYKSQMETSRPNFNRRLFCIEYPGKVNNVNKMLDTLGGVDSIGTAYSSKNRRVELRFRPDDVYCKPACGDRHSTIGLLIKVKIKKKSRDLNMPCSSKDSEKLQSMTFVTSLVGVVDTIYKFDNLCDFQYLPMERPLGDPSSKLENIYDRLFPSTLPDLNWLQEDNVPYFLTPPVFSRFDTIHYYSSQKTEQGKSPVKKTKEKRKDATSNTIGRTRKRRQGYGMFVNYSDGHVPSKPNPEALKLLRIKFLNEEHFNTLKKLFEERPVWSKNGLLHRTNFSKDQLKYLLPTVAYYFVTGPWRVMWCRYGYDPRKNIESYIYQTFDYRIRTTGGLKNRVKPKRSYSNYLLPYKSSPSCRPKVVIINRHSIARAFHEARKDNGQERPHENTYVFRPGYVPPTRQMFFQYCDIHVPEIQTMLQRLSATHRPVCHPRLGFLPTGFDSKCREIINSLVAAELRKEIQSNQDEEQQDSEDSRMEDEDLESTEEILDSDLEDSLYQ